MDRFYPECGQKTTVFGVFDIAFCLSRSTLCTVMLKRLPSALGKCSTIKRAVKIPTVNVFEEFHVVGHFAFSFRLGIEENFEVF